MGQRSGIGALGRVIVGAALGCAVTAAAVTVPAPPVLAQAAQSYSAINVEGNQRIDAATVLTYAGITTGTPLSTGQLNAAYQRIVASGLFESVEMVPSGRTLTIRVKEFPTINRVAIEGNRRLSDEVLEPLLKSKSRRVFSPSTAEEDARAIAEAYRQAGRLAATVTPKVIPRSQNRVDVVFEVTEGAVVEVERIAFVGNRSFTDRRLRQVLGTRQAGIFRAVIGSDSYVEDRIAFDRQVLTDFYRARGYIDAQVLSANTEFSRERNAFFITFNIREGLKYKFGKVSIASEVEGLDAARYNDTIRTRPGQVYSPLRIDDGITRIERQTLREGLDFIRVEPRLERNETAQTLDLTYVLTRGPRVFIERIDVEGNTGTRDDVIRREFTSVEGDPFNPREIRAAAERIRALGYFSKAEVNAREGSGPDRVIVDVDVEEQPTGNIGFGINYSVDEGVGLALSLSERNFLGRGQQLSFSANIGTDSESASFRFTDPALFGRDVSGGVNLYFDNTNNFNATYDTREVGVSPSIGFPTGDFSRVSLRYTIADKELSGVDDDSSVILLREEGSYLTSAVGYSYTYDTRKVGLNPDAGWRFVFSQDFAGVGGDAKYIESTALIGAESKVMGRDLNLSLELEGGALTMLDGQDSGLLDRFRTGRKVRGFSYNGLGPRDTGAKNEDALGGKYYSVLRAEADFPLGLPVEYGVRGGVFFDAGSLWGLDDTAGSKGEVDDDFHLRTVIGASLFWSTPIGPLRFDFTRALQKESYDDERTFDFSINTRF